ncbi:class I SAM-dependent methyltransferase [Sphingopyxis sp.]|uniref:class I SAM-dependent methyltransferase n=1 Tax=Sphingopyxis sp. TaxID=1908224 RepID=UPI0035AEEA7D
MRKSRSKPRIWDTDWLVLRPLSRLILDHVRTHSPAARLVDLGCGDMPYKAELEQQSVHYLGADIDDGGDLRIDANGRVPLEEQSVDAVLSVQVLEHVRDLGIYFGEIRRLLRRDGILYLSTHGSWLYHPHPEDHRRWTGPGLVAELDAHGFRVEESVALVGPLATTTLIRMTGFVFFLRKIPLLGSAIANGLAVLMNLRALIEDKLTPATIRQNDACVYFVRARCKP